MTTEEAEILLVEDNASDAEMTIRALRKNKLDNSLLHLTDGTEALDYLYARGQYTGRSQSGLPKVILLDLKMPKLDGLDVLKRLKSDDRTKLIPVVVLTSSKEDSDVEKCYLLGVNSYIVKPVEFNRYTQAVSDIGLYWMILNQTP